MEKSRGLRGLRGIQGKQGIAGVNNYIDAKTFKEFCNNQEKLIGILNHRMTGIENSTTSIKVDVAWLKKSLWVIIGLVMAILATVLTKAVLGG